MFKRLTNKLTEVSQNKLRFSPESISLLSEAKDHYWRALKADAPEQMRRELCVNLANSLDSAGRLVEALFWYDQALSIDQTFGMAQCNKGIALMFLNELSGTYTISLIDEVRKSFKFALEDPNLFPHLAEIASKRIREIDSNFLKLGWTDDRIARDNKQHDEEYEQHDEYWKFCLANHLALSEHSLYCKCAGARRDDLSIIKQSGSIAGDFVPKLELLLNRLKSEYCFARALYYQSLRPERKWLTDSYQGTFTEQYEGEAIGIEEEFLRNSFRLCFGILDRIAQGLNELFSFAEPEEHLYFDSFWRKKGKNGVKRWCLKSMREAFCDCDWQRTMEVSRRYSELLRNDDLIKEIFTKSGITEDAYIELNSGFKAFFQYFSKYIHDKAKGQAIKIMPVAYREDAELAYTLSMNIFNMISRKLKRANYD